MSLSGPLNPPSDDDEGWGGCSDSSSCSSDSESSFASLDSETPSGPTPLAEFDDNTAYPTIEALQDAVNAFAKAAGYALGRSHGKKKKGADHYKKYTLYCTRGGQERESSATLRNTTTLNTSCKYQCTARFTDEGWRWEQAFDPAKRTHNHEPALDPSVFRQHRVVTSPMKRQIKSLSGHYAIKSREMKAALGQAFPDSCLTQKDVNNQ
jgi:hypothetical protein